MAGSEQTRLKTRHNNKGCKRNSEKFKECMIDEGSMQAERDLRTPQ
jgi:hypothetical protein